MSKGSLWDYIVTGLKLWVVSLLSGIIFWIFAFIFGASVFTIFTGGATGTALLLGIIMLILAIPTALIIAGFVAQKIWKWD